MKSIAARNEDGFAYMPQLDQKLDLPDIRLRQNVISNVLSNQPSASELPPPND